MKSQKEYYVFSTKYTSSGFRRTFATGKQSNKKNRRQNDENDFPRLSVAGKLNLNPE
jgi:hypothetical protein